MKLLVTGGHPSPAFATIDYVHQHYPEVEIVFVGRLTSQHQTGQQAWEQNEAAARSIPFIPISTGKSGFHGVRITVAEYLKTIQAIFKSIAILRAEKPSVVLSFGSYVAIPVTIAAWLLRIPIVTHEQTHAAGRSNWLISKFASRVAVSYEGSLHHFPANKTSVTGLPVRQELFLPAEKPSWLIANSETPLLLIIGGSTGSVALNTYVLNHLTTLTSDYVVIHQTGLPSRTNDWQQKCTALLQQHPALAARYVPRPVLTSQEMAWIYRHAAVVLSRSGANTTAELAALNVPALLVPLPTSQSGEQLANALYLENKGLAIVCNQEDLATANVVPLLAKLQAKTRMTTVQSSEPQAKLTEIIMTVAQSANKKTAHHETS